MTKHEEFVPVALLREFLNLDMETGRMTWRAREPRHFQSKGNRSAETICRNFNSTFAGTEAMACRDQFNHLIGQVNRHKIYAHRAVFALVHGHWPVGFIDHINGDAADNRPANLRDVPHIVNLRNAKRSKANKSGVTGVSFNKRLNKWHAHITVNYRNIHLGFFTDLESAAEARRKAVSQHDFHPNHGRG